MKLTFRVNGARLGAAARPVSPSASSDAVESGLHAAALDGAPDALDASPAGSSTRLAASPLGRRFGLRVNRGTLAGASRADLASSYSARPTAIAPEGSEPTYVDPSVDRSAS